MEEFAITQAHVNALILIWIAAYWLLFALDYSSTKELPNVPTMIIIVIGGPVLLVGFGIYHWYNWYIERKETSPYRKKKT